jgi:5-methylcytosine-specific restriction protein A
VLLCERHHTLVHQDGWLIEIVGGLPWFTPPAWIDARRTPRLHSRYKTRQLDDP